MQMLHKFDSEYKVIFIGDASMSPYEIFYEYGSVEHMNKEAGKVWLERVKQSFKNIVWINPVQKDHWHYTQSIGMVQKIFDNKMFPLTVSGITEAMKHLS
jgi:hypothetical protein